VVVGNGKNQQLITNYSQTTWLNH